MAKLNRPPSIQKEALKGRPKTKGFNSRPKRKFIRNTSEGNIKTVTENPLWEEIVPRWKSFILEYLKDYNGLAAAKRVGYSEKSAHVSAHMILRDSRVRKIIDDWEKNLATRFIDTEEKVKKELSLLAYSDIADYMTEEGELRVASLRDLPSMATRAIRRVKYWRKTRKLAKDGPAGSAGDVISDMRVDFELYDKRSALELLGKQIGMFVDRKELTGKNGAPLIPGSVELVFDFGNEDSEKKESEESEHEESI